MSKWKVQPFNSPLSPVVAKMYMQDLECRTPTTAPLKPPLWLSFADDTLVIWTHSDKELQGFLEYLNDQCAEIQFTMEKESEGSIPFLDVHVKEESKLTISVYRKPTHTDRYFHYYSHHHLKVNFGIVDCLHHRTEWMDEKKHIQNGNPK